MKNIITHKTWTEREEQIIGAVTIPKVRRYDYAQITIVIWVRSEDVALQVKGLSAQRRESYSKMLGIGADTLEDLGTIAPYGSSNSRDMSFETIEQATRAGHRLLERLRAYAKAIEEADEAEYEASIKGLETD